MSAVGQSRFRPLRLLPYAVLCILLGFTLWASWRVTTVTRQKNRWHFNNAVLEVETSIADEVSNFVAMLRAGAGYAAANPNMSNSDFAAFVDRLQLPRFYPGVQGIGFAKRVGPADVNALEKQMRAKGFEEFAIRPEGARPMMFPVIYLEPLDRRNQHAVGYDMFTEPIRRTAMLQALTNGPALSGKVTLVQEIDDEKQPGFLLYVPVFPPGAPPKEPAKREAVLVGFIYSPFRAGDFFEASFRKVHGSRLHYTIYDSDVPDQQKLLFDSPLQPSAHPWITTNRVVQVANHHWTVVFETTPEFEEILGGKTAVFVPVAGVIASLVIFGFTGYFVRQHEELLRRGKERDKAQQQIEMLNRDLERRVQERTAELQDINDQMEAFTYSVAHDLRAPLRAIRGFTEILREECAQSIDESAQHYISRIVRSAQDMDTLIRDLLNFSQISRGKVQLAPVSLDKVFEELRGQLEMDFKDMRAEIAIDSPLPSVLAHEATLKQAMANLLSNAVKFVKPGHSPHVHVHAESGGNGHVRVWIEDDGIGIAPEYQQRIFGVFERLNKNNYSGTGIGLAIVRRAVERMGGEVGVQSKLGEGSRFYVELQKA